MIKHSFVLVVGARIWTYACSSLLLQFPSLTFQLLAPVSAQLPVITHRSRSLSVPVQFGL
uniref:Uncharacterized protein n=2 Tax=Picea TaxID=3328 RepID=A0A101LXE5_PICGL|nr:hypothetical protein ABT39_MTgene6085 [Picea glauca]QHR89956.1 hypothetical protein Q903MT_gene3978 [Picea sitchensis]